jgi:hypothetical protein
MRLRRVAAFPMLAAFVVAWPAVQMTLVWVYDVTPWKLGGFGMYAVPFPRPVDLLVADSHGRFSQLEIGQLPPGGLEAVERLRMRRRFLGKLANPSRAAQMLAPAVGLPMRLAFRTTRLSSDGYFHEFWDGYSCEKTAGGNIECREVDRE